MKLIATGEPYSREARAAAASFMGLRRMEVATERVREGQAVAAELRHAVGRGTIYDLIANRPQFVFDLLCRLKATAGRLGPLTQECFDQLSLRGFAE